MKEIQNIVNMVYEWNIKGKNEKDYQNELLTQIEKSFSNTNNPKIQDEIAININTNEGIKKEIEQFGIYKDIVRKVRNPNSNWRIDLKIEAMSKSVFSEIKISNYGVYKINKKDSKRAYTYYYDFFKCLLLVIYDKYIDKKNNTESFIACFRGPNSVAVDSNEIRKQFTLKIEHIDEETISFTVFGIQDKTDYELSLSKNDIVQFTEEIFNVLADSNYIEIKFDANTNLSDEIIEEWMSVIHSIIVCLIYYILVPENDENMVFYVFDNDFLIKNLPKTIDVFDRYRYYWDNNYSLKNENKEEYWLELCTDIEHVVSTIKEEINYIENNEEASNDYEEDSNSSWSMKR